MKSKLIFLIVIAVLLNSCSSTRPVLNHSGGNYNSVSDDILLHNSTKEAIEKLANALNPKEKVLIVQIVNSENNDLLSDRIYEELYKRGFTVGVSTKSELNEIDSEYFEKYLMFYPTVFGTETSRTVSSKLTGLFSIVPVIGWIIAPIIIANNNYEDRQAGVNIHCRLVDAKSGEINWMQNFSGQDMIRLKGGLKQIIFPN